MKYSPYTNYYLKKIISNGESSRQVFDRALFYFNHAIFPGMKQGEIPLIVTHKHTARVLLKHFLNITNDEIFEKYDFQRSELLQLIMDENKQVINTLSFKIEE